mgnify:CR=1 FL=1
MGRFDRDPGPEHGVGGLSVWREIRHHSPDESIVYVADQAYVPYGPRPRDELRALTARITRFLLIQECKLVVVACNAASAAALHWLREQFPDTPFVGMEPAIKPAAASSKNRCVGVLATPATLEGELFLNTVAREASDLRIVAEPCPGLVARIESGALADADTRALLAAAGFGHVRFLASLTGDDSGAHPGLCGIVARKAAATG